MRELSAGQTAQRVAGFLSEVAAQPDEDSACAFALERISSVFEARVALVTGTEVELTRGWTVSDTPIADLIRISAAGKGQLRTDSGDSTTAAVAVIDAQRASALVVAKHGRAELSSDETATLAAMARGLGVTLRLKATERTLRDRERLQDAMATIRRSISDRAPLSDVLDAIVEAVSDLLDGGPAGLYLLDPNDDTYLDLVAHRHFHLDIAPTQCRRKVGAGVAGRAVQDGTVVITDNYQTSADSLEEFVDAGVQSVIAVPVHENGRVCGCLIVPSYGKRREFTQSEQEMLGSLAEHVSLALTDAKTVDSMLHQALHDGLTGLPNRALFSDRLEHALARTRRGRGMTGVLFLDLDRFKNVNDSLGHAAGDELLVEVARRLDACRRAADTAARLGGDEFAVLLEDLAGADEGVMAAERILGSLGEPYKVQGRDIRVPASVGLAVDESDSEDFLRHADVAMYRAKAKGRGQLCVFEAEMQDELTERLGLEADLPDAIERGEISIHYQPVVTIDDGSLAGFEALARWDHPERGQLQPASFIEVAEESGTINELGRYVLDTACEQARIWSEEIPDESVFMSVNLSGRQLERVEIVEDVRAALTATGIDPSMLMLEITETVLMQDTEVMIERLEQLRALGVRLAIDDFGTGYSSLRYLRRFPVDALKMAKPFVDGLADDTQSAALARTIIDLAANLGIACIAEGIETDAQKVKLRELGCGLGQGFHFAHPTPSRQLSELLVKQKYVPAFPV